MKTTAQTSGQHNSQTTWTKKEAYEQIVTALVLLLFCIGLPYIFLKYAPQELEKDLTFTGQSCTNVYGATPHRDCHPTTTTIPHELVVGICVGILAVGLLGSLYILFTQITCITGLAVWENERVETRVDKNGKRTQVTLRDWKWIGRNAQK